MWGITGEKPAAREPLIPSIDGKSAAKTSLPEARFFPPLFHAPDQEQAVQLDILRRRVKEYWVDGVLKHSLYNEVLISLGRRQADEFVDAPWKYTGHGSDAVGSPPLDNRDVCTRYDTTGLLKFGPPLLETS